MIYPQSHAIHGDPASLLQNMAANPAACGSIYLDTTQAESKSIFTRKTITKVLPGRTSYPMALFIFFFRILSSVDKAGSCSLGITVRSITNMS